jgi:predicted nuclease with TOPRIM domain
MALESYRTENSKLDEQLYKLKTAKSEMTKLFYELDRMIDSDEVIFNFILNKLSYVLSLF